MSDTPRNDSLSELLEGMSDSDKHIMRDLLSRKLERENLALRKEIAERNDKDFVSMVECNLREG